MMTTPFYFYGAETKDRFEEKLEIALDIWKSEWINQDLEVQVVEIRGNLCLDEIPNAHLFFDGVVVCCSDQQELAIMVVGDNNACHYEKTRPFKHLIDKVVNQLITKFVELLSDDNVEMTVSTGSDVAPYVIVDLKIGEVILSFYFSSAWMLKHYPINMELSCTPDMQALSVALNDTSAEINITAGQINLSLNELSGLKKGDLLLTNVFADEPLIAKINKNVVFTTYLGVSQGNKAAVIENVKFQEGANR